MRNGGEREKGREWEKMRDRCKLLLHGHLFAAPHSNEQLFFHCPGFPITFFSVIIRRCSRQVPLLCMPKSQASVFFFSSSFVKWKFTHLQKKGSPTKSIYFSYQCTCTNSFGNGSKMVLTTHTHKKKHINFITMNLISWSNLMWISNQKKSYVICRYNVHTQCGWNQINGTLFMSKNRWAQRTRQ